MAEGFLFSIACDSLYSQFGTKSKLTRTKCYIEVVLGPIEKGVTGLLKNGPHFFSLSLSIYTAILQWVPKLKKFSSTFCHSNYGKQA